ncbi:hypothetical protein MHU86_16310 [Fragilaria crotonensis]|nr:hypothetical protein MHU86_16310 [Fragilaria crotonensis]
MTADAGDHFMLASPSAQSSYSNETSSSQATLSPPLTTSVIDSICFVGKMRELGVRIGEIQLERFYHELHRQSYPNLQDFVRHCKDNATDGSNDESLPSKMLSCLQDNEGNFVTTTSSVHNTTVSQSGKSIKLEIELVDGESVETIISITSSKDNLVASVAVSSQIGSSVECVHSRSSAKYVRNLSAAEIVEQVIHAARAVAEDRITIRNVAFMGSGEPLHNYDSVLAACRFFESIFHLKKGRITISTVGVTPRIHDLRRDLPGVILAVNLHAPTNELRQAILPSHQYGLVGLFEALDQYMSTSERGVSCERYETLARRRAVMIEYLMVKGPTSTLECAHELGRLCWRRSLIVNLLPFLPSSPNDDLRHPPVDEMNLFKSVVSSYDVNCTVRLSLGSDIHQSRVLQAGRNLGSDLVLEPKGILTQNGAAAEKSFQALRTPSRKERRQKQRRVRKCRSEYDYKHSTKLRRDLNTVAEESDTMSEGDLDNSENAFSLNQPRFASYATPDGKTFNPVFILLTSREVT